MNISVTMMPKLQASQLLRDTLDRRWKEYIDELKRCQTEFSNEAVHDLRIATQKVLAVVQVLNAIFPRPRLHKIDQALEAQLIDLDGLRDIQVILAEISEMIQELPELHPFQVHLLTVEERAVRTVRKKLKRFDPADLSRRIRKERHSLETKMKDNLKPRLMQSVDDVFQVAKRRLDWVNPARTVTIQWMGSGFQTFLYAIEFVHPLIKEFPAVHLERMKQYQSLISEIQDVENFLQTLASFSDHEADSEVGPARHYYECRYEEAVAAYSKEMDKLHHFWRSTPDQPFPWSRTE
jgi:CHAD domain-containing protein